MSVAGKHIIVTGASTGIGRAAAVMLAGRGARVSLIARRGDVLREAVAEIVRAGGQGRAFVADVADRAALAGALSAAAQSLGPADGLFANAGFGGDFAPLTAYSDENWDALIATNQTSVFLSIRQVLPAMIARRSGSIVVTGSLSSERGMANNAGYVASKHAVLGLARAAALEAAPHNVRANCLLPGLIETPMLHAIAGDDIPAAMAKLGRAVPQGRVGKPEEAAEAVCFLLSDAASHVTGQSIAVDGGILGTLSLGG
jgi:NAD(P)-dependent dehydrogenase (short-subunit alcohol dehydrogenase family)